MATLQKIRNRAGVLISIVIGLALVSFILGDFLKPGSSMFSDQETNVLEVNGEGLSVMDYERKVQELIELQKNNTGKTSLDETAINTIREQVYTQMLKDIIFSESFEELGLGVHPDELFDMVQGKNVHPQVRQLFQNPNTGEFDRTYVINFLKNLDRDPKAKAFWMYLEESLTKDRAIEKYNNIIQKGINFPTYYAEIEASEKNEKFDIQFVTEKFTAISDSDVTVTDSDIAKYYEENKHKYKQDESREIEYVTFFVEPSKDDDRAAYNYINELKEDFLKIEDDAAFVNMNSDEQADMMYYKAGELSVKIDTIMFAADSGFVYGPYYENESYKLSKISEIRYMPDSIKARHILAAVNEKVTYEQAQAKIDSLKKLIDEGADFAELAKTNSDDPGSGAEGGDLGWFSYGRMVKPFNDACYDGAVGDMPIVKTRFGIHLIHIQEKSEDVKKLRLSTIVRKIEPGETTINTIYANASKFAGMNNTADSFDKAVVEQGLSKKIAALQKNQRNVTGLESSRPLVKWAYNAEANQISDVFTFGDKYVIAKLSKIKVEGIATLAEKKEELRTVVIKHKKAEMLKEKFSAAINSGMSIDDAAAALNLKVRNADNLSFSSFSVPGAGIEPKLIATASASEVGKLSEPIDGNYGVYVFVVTDKRTDKASTAVAEKTNLETRYRNQVSYKAFEAMKEKGDVKDNRFLFY